MIDRPGNQFFAGAAFAENEDVDVLRRDSADRFAHFLNHRRAADDAFAAKFGRQLCRRLHQASRFERLLQQLAHSPQVDRLEQIIERAAFHGLNRGVGGSVRGQED